MLKKILLLNLVLLCSIVFSQQDYNKIKSLPPSSVKSLIDESNIKKENVKDLQDYIEESYINVSKFYNKGALPTLQKGQYNVVLMDDIGNYTYKKSSDFKGMTPDSVENISYKKSSMEEALYGVFGEKFGIITMKLKK